MATDKEKSTAEEATNHTADNSDESEEEEEEEDEWLQPLKFFHPAFSKVTSESTYAFNDFLRLAFF